MRAFVCATIVAVGVWAGASIVVAAPPATHVVLISIDGLRVDAIDSAPAPNLQSLIAEGTYCPVAETVRPSITLPSHTSMLTGLNYPKHGVIWNGDHDGFIEHPTVMSEVKRAGLTTAMFVAKSKFSYLASPGSCDYTFGFDRDTAAQATTTAAQLAKRFSREWVKKKFRFTFVHLREPDIAGHRHLWMSPEYLEGVREADKAVGAIVRSIRKAGRKGDRVVIIVTADHGGKGKTHTELVPEVYTIPWIIVGPGIPAGERIETVIRTFDTMPTVLRLLGVEIPDGIDGHPVELTR